MLCDVGNTDNHLHVAMGCLSMVVKVAAVCLQTSRHDRDEAEQQLSKMTAENADLVQRFHDMKSTEVERMNEVNRACEEMVCFRLMHASSQSNKCVPCRLYISHLFSHGTLTADSRLAWLQELSLCTLHTRIVAQLCSRAGPSFRV